MHSITYFVDGERQTTTDPTLSVRQILEKAGVDPNDHYLVELQGNHRVPHKNLDEVIKVHDHMKFISVSTRPTPVS